LLPSGGDVLNGSSFAKKSNIQILSSRPRNAAATDPVVA
jgi:hypothetical protein